MLPKQTNRLYDLFTRIDGCKANALLTTASNASTKDKVPYRILLVRKPCRFKIGDVIRTPGGELLLLLEHPNDLTWTENFKAQSITGVYEWQRPQKILHPVAKVLQDNGNQDMGMVYCTFDTPEDVSLDKMLDTKYRFLTGQDVKVDDVVDGKIVKKVVQVLGVKLVYAS